MHIHEGYIWAVRGRSLPAILCEQTDDLSQLMPDDVGCVRIVGATQNLGLICRAWSLKQCGRLDRVELVTPLVCRLACDRTDPAKLLHQTYRPLLAPSQGGCHEVTEKAAQLYHCAYYPVSSVGSFSRMSLGKALSFVRHVNLQACLKLVALIVDPRWFVDLSRPDRTAKLENFCGLNPKTQSGVLKMSEPWRQHHHCELVMRAWTYGWQPSQVPEDFLPGEFVLQTFWSHWMQTADHERRAVKSYLRASQKFMRFFRFVWLNAIYEGSPSIPDRSAPLFRPEDLFATQQEAGAFRDHIENC